MSESEKSSAVDVANLSVNETEVTEDPNNGESTNHLTTEPFNSNITVTMETGNDEEKNKEGPMGATEGTESGAGGNTTNTTEPPPKPYILSGSSTLTREAKADYLKRLIEEKEELKSLLPNSFHFKHAVRLVDEEIAQVRDNLERMSAVYENEGGNQEAPGIPTSGTNQEVADKLRSGTKVFLQEKIFIPVNEYPNYNFVGRILGPRGMTAKQLEEESGCRIMIRGRGSTREGSSRRQNIDNNHLKEELHVLVQCEDFEQVARRKMKRAVESIRHMLVPPPEGEDDLKRKQLMELSIINGTYRPTIASRIALRNRPFTPSFIETENAFRLVNSPVFGNDGGIEDARHRTTYDPRAGTNLRYAYAQHYPYNACTLLTRQALASLGFDMDAFEMTDYYGKRITRTSARQVAASATVPPAAQYPPRYGFRTAVVDPFTMEYMWNSPINPPLFGVSNGLTNGYYNQVIAGLPPTVNSDGTYFGEVLGRPPNGSRPNLQRYITAATLLNGVPNFHTGGSGDGPNGRR